MLFLFIDASGHGLIEVPLLIEHEWAGVFQALNKINYAHAMVSSRMTPYTRSAYSNEQIRRSRVISLTGRKGGCSFFGEMQEQHVHMLKETARRSRDLQAVTLAAGYCAHLARVQRFWFRIALLKVPSSTHMVSSRAREILLLTGAMKHMKVGDADSRRTIKCSLLAPFVRANYLQVHGTHVPVILNLQCFTPGGPNGFPVIKTPALAIRVGGSTELCAEGSMLIGWSIGLPNLQCGKRMHFSFAGRWPDSSLGGCVSLATLLGNTVKLKVDLTTGALGVNIQQDGTVVDVQKNSQGAALGLVAGKAKVISIGGTKIKADGSSVIADMMKPNGAEGRRFRTYEFELRPCDVSCMTLWIYQKDSAATHRQGMLNLGDKAGAELRTRQKQQLSKFEKTAVRGTSPMSQSEMTRVSFDKQIDETLHHEKSTVNQFHTVPASIRKPHVSKQDSSPPHGLVVDSSELIFHASQKYALDAVKRYLTRRGKDDARSRLLSGLLRGKVKARVVTFADQAIADRLANIDNQTKSSTLRMNDMKKSQLSAVDALVQLINAPEAYKSVNHDKIMQLHQTILDLNREQKREELLRIHLSGLRERIMNRGQDAQAGDVGLHESIDSMSDAVYLTSTNIALSTIERQQSSDDGQRDGNVTNSQDHAYDTDTQFEDSVSESESDESDSQDEDDLAFWEELRRSSPPSC